jgi:hypothetical protein
MVNLPPTGMPRGFLRRLKEENNPTYPGSRFSSIVPRRRNKKWDFGLDPRSPNSQLAVYPQRRSQIKYVSERTLETQTPSSQSPETEKDVPGRCHSCNRAETSMWREDPMELERSAIGADFTMPD